MLKKKKEGRERDKKSFWEGPISFFSEKIDNYGKQSKAKNFYDNIDLQRCKGSFFSGAINLTEGEDLG